MNHDPEFLARARKAFKAHREAVVRASFDGPPEPIAADFGIVDGRYVEGDQFARYDDAFPEKAPLKAAPAAN